MTLQYPTNVKIIDGDVNSIDELLNGVGNVPATEVYSSSSCLGDKCAFIDDAPDKRTMYFHSAFLD